MISRARWIGPVALLLFGCFASCGDDGSEVDRDQTVDDPLEVVAPPALTSDDPSAKLIVFRFAPPDATVSEELTRTETIVRLEGEEPQKKLEETRTVAHYRRTEEGYSVALEYQAPAQIGALLKAMQKQGEVPIFRVAVDLDPQGALVAVHGLENQVEALSEFLPPLLLKIAEPMIHASFQNLQSQWQDRFRLVPDGSQAPLGERMEMDYELPLGDGEGLPGKGWFEFVEWVEDERSPHVRMRFGYRSEDPSIGTRFGQLLFGQFLDGFASATGMGDDPGLGKAKAILTDLFSGGSMSMEIETVLDPQTLLPKSTNSTRTVEFDITAPGEPKKTMNLTWLIESTFTYEAPK